MDTQLMFSNTGDDRSTPQWLFDLLNNQYDFNIDAAANKHNTKCPVYFNEESDGLKQVWRETDRLFINPPYSKVRDWVAKSAANSALSVQLVAARTDTRWWHDFVFNGADWVLFYKGRLKFNGMKTPAPFPSAIVGYNCEPPGGVLLGMGFLLDLA